MERKPRKSDEPILNRAALIWLAVAGFVELASVFGLETFDDRRFALTTGIAAIVLGTQLGLFNRILHTVGLNLHEWLICIVAALTIVVASEIRKLILRRRQAEPEPEPAVTMTAAA